MDKSKKVQATMPVVSHLGPDAILFDPSNGAFDDGTQHRIWGLSDALALLPWVRETVPGMNNLMVVFEAETITPTRVIDTLLKIWPSQGFPPHAGRLFEAPTVYGGAEMEELARRLGISAGEVARLHAELTYSVAAVGAMPGFVYLSGLDPRLAWRRLASPRASIPAGSVMIGGAQTGIMPRQGPTGWRCIGRTSLVLFDPRRDPPALFQPGDRLKFQIVGVEA